MKPKQKHETTNLDNRLVDNNPAWIAQLVAHQFGDCGFSISRGFESEGIQMSEMIKYHIEP